MLPQLVFFAAVIVAFGYGSRWVMQEVARVESQMGRLSRILARNGSEPVPQLKLDEATGLYLPMKF